ncbi:MAG: toxin-antitoxin system HicB family antitoxin [Candidatus Hodarchaeota archaeon]
MSKTNVLTLRVPWDLKRRLEQEAKFQGVSLNQASNYLLNEQLTQLELISSFESRLAEKSIDNLKIKVSNILKKVPRKETPS